MVTEVSILLSLWLVSDLAKIFLNAWLLKGKNRKGFLFLFESSDKCHETK